LAKIDNPFARKALDNNWVKPNKRIFNNAKVGDHFAIIPTGAVARSLDEYEHKIFDLIAKRFVAVFFPPAQYENTTRITRVEGEPFKTEGKILVAAGGKFAASETRRTRRDNRHRNQDGSNQATGSL
jgi:DNA topoisomerase III